MNLIALARFGASFNRTTLSIDDITFTRERVFNPAFALSGGSIVSVRAGVWARDANDFIFIGKVEDDKLYGLNMWRFDEDKNLDKVIFAEEVDYQQDNNWLMRYVQITDMENENVITKRDLEQMEWHTSLAPDKLAVVTVKPEELSLSGLYDYVTYLKASEQDASRYELAFWRKLSQPLSIAVVRLKPAILKSEI